MIIQLEDGRKLEIQDGATDDQIDEVINEISTPQVAPSTFQPQVAPNVSKTESLLRGGVQGTTLGYGDEAMGAIGAAYAKVMDPELMKDQSFGSLYTQARDSARQDDALARENNPKSFLAGQVLGSIPTGAKIPLPGSTLGNYAAGAGLGAIAGLGSSDSKTTTGQLTDTAYGAGSGIAGMYIGNMLGKGISAIAGSKSVKGAKEAAMSKLASFYSKTPDIAPAPQSPFIVEAMRNGATPEEAAALELANKFGVPLSRGDVVRTPQQQGLEDLAYRGALGDEANNSAVTFRNQQAQALKDAAKKMTTDISGQPYMDDTAQAGAALSARLKGMESAEDAGVSRAYEAVKDAGEAKIAVPFINKHLKTAYDELGNYPLEEKSMPATLSVINRAKLVFKENPDGQFTAPADISEVENFRKFIGRSGNTVQVGNKTDMAGITIIKKKLDGAINEAVEKNLVYGEPAAIEKLKNARELASSYFKTWKADDVVQNIVENNYTPEQVLNLVRGYGQVGGNKQASALVDKIGVILGKDSQEFGMMKQAQLKQIFGKNLDAILTGDLSKGFSAEEVRKNLNGLISNNKSLADAYFTPQDQQVLKDFLSVSYRATNRVPGAANTSNTTPALIRWGRQFANQFGMLGRLVGAGPQLVAHGMDSIKKGADADEAIQSFSSEFSNPNNALAVALKNKITQKLGASGAIVGGQKPAYKDPYKITVRPSKEKIRLNQFYNQQE